MGNRDRDVYISNSGSFLISIFFINQGDTLWRLASIRRVFLIGWAACSSLSLLGWEKNDILVKFRQWENVSPKDTKNVRRTSLTALHSKKTQKNKKTKTKPFTLYSLMLYYSPLFMSWKHKCSTLFGLMNL